MACKLRLLFVKDIVRFSISDSFKNLLLLNSFFVFPTSRLQHPPVVTAGIQKPALRLADPST